jgi:hypothetical protein
MATETVTAALEGTEFTIGNDSWVVGPKCEESLGQWVCTTHGEVFGNQMMKDSHIRSGVHVLAWVCYSHGAEIP